LPSVLKDGQFEHIYLRPTNGRADDQVRRNHSAQYSAHPNFSFAVSRAQAPERYGDITTKSSACRINTGKPHARFERGLLIAALCTGIEPTSLTEITTHL
jgi:hypothetical protein